jgi:hypothetical protein
MQIAGDGHRVHPQTIVEGFRLASKEALKALEAAAVDNRLAHFDGVLSSNSY